MEPLKPKTFSVASAFLPSCLFHCAWECLLGKLRRAKKDKLAQHISNSLLSCKEGKWTATWQSSFEHVEDGYSTFVSNCQESRWAADQILAGPGAPLEVVPTLIERLQQQTSAWHQEPIEIKAEYLSARGGSDGVECLQQQTSAWQQEPIEIKAEYLSERGGSDANPSRSFVCCVFMPLVQTSLSPYG